MQEVKRIIRKMFHIVPLVTYDLYWKFHEILYSRFIIFETGIQTNTQTISDENINAAVRPV